MGTRESSCNHLQLPFNGQRSTHYPTLISITAEKTNRAEGAAIAAGKNQ